MLPEQLDRAHHLVGRDVVGLHEREELVATRVAIGPHALVGPASLLTPLRVCLLTAIARKKPILAGALIGLGTAGKLYPLLLLGPLFVLCLRTGQDGRPWTRGMTAAAVGWLVSNLPAMLVYPTGW